MLTRFSWISFFHPFFVSPAAYRMAESKGDQAQMYSAIKRVIVDISTSFHAIMEMILDSLSINECSTISFLPSERLNLRRRKWKIVGNIVFWQSIFDILRTRSICVQVISERTFVNPELVSEKTCRMQWMKLLKTLFFVIYNTNLVASREKKQEIIVQLWTFISWKKKS